MIIRFKHLACCFLFLLIVNSGAAQLLGLKKIAVPSKNSQESFTTSFINHQGFIYVGTTNGLYKFNGSTFTSAISSSISDTISVITTDNKQQLWVGFTNGKIAMLVNQQLQYYQPEEGLSKRSITAMLFDNNNNLWFAVYGEGIYYQLNNHLYLINEENGLSDLSITKLIFLNNKIIAASDNGFFICSTTEQTKKAINISPKEGLPDYIVTCFEKIDNHNILVGMQEKGFCIYNVLTGKITIPSSSTNWQWDEVSAIKYLNNQVWVATKENGVLKSSNINSATDILQPIANIANVINIQTDIEENIWLLNKESLTKTLGSKLKQLPLYDEKIFETIHAIIKTTDNTIWAGTDGGIINYTFQNGKYISKKISIAGLSDKIDVTAICVDTYQNLWLGTLGKGIFVVNPKTGAYRNITENSLLTNASILSVTSVGNTVCAGGLEGVASIFELNETNQTIDEPYSYTNYNDKQNIGNNYIYTVFKDSKSRIWFGTNATGITVLQNGNFTNYNISNGLDAKNVLSFTEDKKGGIWFCTENSGIYKYDGGKFLHFTTDNGLSNLANTNIKTDNTGNIIVIHKNGFDVIDVTTEKIIYYNKTHDIEGVSIDLGTVSSNADGSILFTTPHGFIEYNAPSKNASNAPITAIESILLHLKNIDTSTSHIFSYDENSFTFNFIGLWNTSPELLQYQYKLEGYDTNWIATNDHSKSFAQLEQGKYTFRVRSSLNNNFTNASEASYTFEIRQAIWKRWWFILLCALLSFALIYLYIKEREKELKKMQVLENQKTEFQFQVLRNQVNPHFLFNSFNTLISTIEDNPKIAVDYVENLSDFFRNIVNYRDKDVILLKEELEVLNTYIYLQKKRYGDNLIITINASELQQNNIKIPPLTLQLLAENAVKHNAVAASTPLHLSIEVREDGIVLTNNINPKTVVEKSAGMGLQNIINRYALLSNKKVSVEKTATEFIIILPLL